MSSKRITEIVVEILEAAGARHCYDIIGDTLSHVTDAIHHSQIQWVHVCHGGATAFIADAESYISGRLTACADSCGSGSLRLINGVYEAQRDHAPMVLITSQIVTPQLGMEFPQGVDFKAVYASCSVFCEQVHSPEQARWVAVLACQAALNRRGVVVVILSADISQATVKDDLPFSVHFPQPALRSDDVELQDIVHLLAHGKKIDVYAGSGCQGAHDLLMALAGHLKAPIAHASRAKDFIKYDNPSDMGMIGMLGIESGFHMITGCDTLLLLGADFAWAQFYPQKTTLIQVDRDDNHLGCRHPVDPGMIGDIVPTLEALLPLFEVRGEHSFLDECLEYREHSLWMLEKEEQAGEGELIHPQHLVSLLDQRAGEDALFTADGGPTMIWLLRHIHSNGKHHTLASLIHGTMANTMPQALGLKEAYPERQVISISGNGSPAMLLGDLLTAIQEKLPIKVVVLNNASLNFVEPEQKVESLLDNYADLPNPDFARLAEVIGFHGRKVTHSEDLEAAVQEFLAQPDPALLDVHTSPAELMMPPKIEFGQVADATLCAVRAVLSRRFKGVETLLVNNLLR